jgi:hypothetical protein
VATFLVARGEILQAQSRLGHRDAATTLREYAHALPLTDGDVADAINDHLDFPRAEPSATTPMSWVPSSSEWFAKRGLSAHYGHVLA